TTWNTVKDVGLGAGLIALVLLIIAAWRNFRGKKTGAVKRRKLNTRVTFVKEQDGDKTTPKERVNYLLGGI
ncbi:unnamed protein product, partial [Allacma fusca]